MTHGECWALDQWFSVTDGLLVHNQGNRSRRAACSTSLAGRNLRGEGLVGQRKSLNVQNVLVQTLRLDIQTDSRLTQLFDATTTSTEASTTASSIGLMLTRRPSRSKKTCPSIRVNSV